jgi:hypothetical protein
MTQIALDLPVPPPRHPYPDGVPAEVCELFARLATEAHRSGLKHYSADAILHRVRWHEQIERGNREFKANNNWTAPLARWLMARNPAMRGFFEIRKLGHERDGKP